MSSATATEAVNFFSATLVTRSYCSLCVDLKGALERLAQRHTIALQLVEIDLDDHPELEAQFGEWVPVLLAGEGVQGEEICHYRLDEVAVIGYWSNAASKLKL